MTIRITHGDHTTDLITVLNPGTGSGAIHTYTDVDGDRFAVFTSHIPDVGPGVNIRTDPDGCGIPLADIPALVTGIVTAAQQAAHQVGADCCWPDCDPCSSTRANQTGDAQ